MGNQKIGKIQSLRIALLASIGLNGEVIREVIWAVDGIWVCLGTIQRHYKKWGQSPMRYRRGENFTACQAIAGVCYMVAEEQKRRKRPRSRQKLPKMLLEFLCVKKDRRAKKRKTKAARPRTIAAQMNARKAG